MSEQIISVIIPARDEETHLPKCLASIEQARKGISNPVEIIVVLNRCSDSTETIAREAGCIVATCDAKNLAAIRNEGARCASGEIIVTIDADSRMSPNMFFEIVATLTTGKTIGGGVWIDPERLSLGIYVTGLMLLPLVLYYRIFCGLFFCYKKDFDAIGGFNENLSSLEDIDFAKRLKRYGKQQGRRYRNLFSAYITTSCRKFDHFGDWYFVKNPVLAWKLMTGKDQKGADEVWYDFPR